MVETSFSSTLFLLCFPDVSSSAHLIPGIIGALESSVPSRSPFSSIQTSSVEKIRRRRKKDSVCSELPAVH